MGDGQVFKRCGCRQPQTGRSMDGNCPRLTERGHGRRATLRAALNAAVREGLRPDNPARHVDLPGPRRPHAEVWTDRRVAAWHSSGERAPVAVWTVNQLTAFLRFVENDRLQPMWW